jgi:hypothetical protein
MCVCVCVCYSTMYITAVRDRISHIPVYIYIRADDVHRSNIVIGLSFNSIAFAF